MSRPAVMLPKARRVIGLVIVLLFSLMGVSAVSRVKPVWTISVMRRVYVAVNDVAKRVRTSAQVFR